MKKNSLLRGTIVLPASVFLALLLLSTVAFGQAGTSTVNGTVSDQQGNLVPGATVTLSNAETSFVRTQAASSSGRFTFNLLPPGHYQLAVEAKGFKKAVVTDVDAGVDKATDLQVALEIGNVSETVTVTSAANEVLLNTQDATIGNNFNTRQITQLPLEARNPISLLTLQPGVTRAGNVTGARSDQSNITLDGVDVNEAQTNDINAPVLRLNSEAIEEFRVVVSNPNATQGRSSGAQISLITKSGSNTWHAALFEAHRNTIFTANNFFSNRSNVPRPALIRNTYGGAIGGPVIKDRLFFFYSYEGRRDASQAALPARTVPLPSLGRGDVKFLGCGPGVTPANCGTTVTPTTQTLTAAQLNTLFPAVGLNPAALAVLANAATKYAANSPGGDGFNTGAFIFNAPTKVNLNSHQLKVDYNLTKSGSQQVFFRASYQYDKQPVSFTNPQQFPDSPLRTQWYHPYGYVVGHTWTLSSRKTNNFRYGLTRLAVSNLGDTGGNDIFFRFVFTPTTESYTSSRTNPVHNIVDDFSWISGDHTLQFGANVRVVRNLRADFGPGFDQALTNPLFYQSSGNVLLTPVTTAGYTIKGNQDDLKAALAAVIGRFSQYTARFNFDLGGQPMQSGIPTVRNFATESYDGYFQDSWKYSQNLTLTYGLRYSLSKPVYEKQGFMATPNIPLGEYLQRRIDNATKGINYVEPIIVNLSKSFYNWDKNNFQPRIAVAWSPDFGKNAFGRLIGRHGNSVIRGGFAITNDYFGEQLAVTFNSQNSLGFNSSQTTAANTFNVTTRPAPLFTGFGQNVRSLPLITIPGNLTFPQQRASNNSRRIESSLDGHQVSPVNYTWNVSIDRDLPHGMVLEAAYVGRAARHLLAGRDAVQTNLNFTDPRSGQNWTQAASVLEMLRSHQTAVAGVTPQPFFENLYTPGSLCGALGVCTGLSNTQAVYLDALNFNGNDWTTTQNDLDAFSGHRYFYQPQYGALAVYSTIAASDYHGATLSLRQRFKEVLSYDINYTFSKSMDDVSGLQTDAPFTPFILNALSIKQQRAVSDFDIRHIVNANMIWQLPFGRNRAFFSDAPKGVNAVLGGWQLSSIFRWNSGLPVEAPLDFGGWPTNWNRRNYTTRIAPVTGDPNRGGATPANLFADPNAAYKSFRSGLPGERGDRNIFRYPGYVAMDIGMAKSWTMPWSERHTFQLRWEVFNVTNTQRLTSVDGFTQGLDPFSSARNPNFGNFTAIQGSPRVMQVGFRYAF